jgi:membrane-bound inhibitor of C-type lysozyme
MPSAGTYSAGITFTPTDTTNYTTTTGTITITVNKATPTITTSPTGSAITYGQALSASTLSSGVASVAGSFAYTASATTPSAGTPSVGITFMPTDTTNYTTATGTITITVNQATQTISFTGPGNQAFSTSPIALSATASSGLTVTFSVFSGPASVSSSTLTLTGAGTVVVRASQAGNGNYQMANYVDRSFTVSANFASWKQSMFTAGELADPNKSGPNAVYGLDGLTNLTKYALGLEPKQNITSGLPELAIVGGNYTYTYSRPSTITDVTYSVEACTDLVTWATTGVTQELVLSSGGIDTWRGRYTVGAESKVFFRLKVILSP